MEFIILSLAAGNSSRPIVCKKQFEELDAFFSKGFCKVDNGLLCCYCKKSIEYPLFSLYEGRPAHFSCMWGNDLCIVKWIAEDGSGRKKVRIYDRRAKKIYSDMDCFTVDSRGRIVKYKPVRTWCCGRRSKEGDFTIKKKKRWILPFWKKKHACNLCGHTFRRTNMHIFYDHLS